MLQLSLLDLQQGPSGALLDKVARDVSPVLAALAGRFARAFIIGSSQAPGFCCVGAELALDTEAAAAYGAPRLSIAGNGESLELALVSCLGEAADRLAVVERPGDVLAATPPREAVEAIDGSWIAEATSPAPEFDWVGARDVVTAQPLTLPADLCLRRAPERRRIKPVGALSSGVAAGPDFATAALRAGLELCERDAAALWWLGGRRPAGFPLEHPAGLAGATLLAALRQGQTDRRTLLLDITTELGVPVVAAASLDSQGRGLAVGLAARLDWAEAARGAVLEMCQMEMAAPLAEAKRTERGDAALNAADRQHLQRAAFAASDCELLRPHDLSSLAAQSANTDDRFGEFAARLGSHGIRLAVLDLTRADVGVAAARVMSPQLQPYSADVVTDRLRDCRTADGGRLHVETASVPLM